MEDLVVRNVDKQREALINKIIEGRTGFSHTGMSKKIKRSLGIVPPLPFLQTGHYIRAIRIRKVSKMEAALFIKDTPVYGIVDVSKNKTLYQVVKYQDITMVDVAKSIETGKPPKVGKSLVYAPHLNSFLEVSSFAPKAPWSLWNKFFNEWRKSKIVETKGTMYDDIIRLFNSGKVVKINRNKVFRISANKQAEAVKKYPRIPPGILIRRRKK